MIRIRGTLLPDHILLSLAADSRDEAVRELLETLRLDLRVTDWPEFSRALQKREAAGKVKLAAGLAMPHIRTAAVTKMVMAFGRLKEPVQDMDGPIQFMILVGIPLTMDAEYLRLVGIMMRAFRHEKMRDELRLAEKSGQIIDVFERVETGAQ
jgi:mannitol/fructose-specific phosphotransferase system IIA component (Ntr-type)